MDIVNNPHDKFFKSTFGDINTAKDFLDNYLPVELKNIVDLESIRLENGSYIDSELKEYQSDLLFRTNIASQEGYIYFLLEHKSYSHKPTVFQILKYMLKIWEARLKDYDEKLPIIIPLVIHHGEREWRVPKRLSEFLDGYEGICKEAGKYIPDYEYELYDISSFSNEDIKGQAKLRIIIDIMKNIFNPDTSKLKEVAKRAMKTLESLEQKETGTELFEVLVRYILNGPQDLEIEDIYDMAKEVSKERSDKIMTLADKLRQEGMLKGRLEGRQEGWQEGIEYLLWKQILKKFPKTPESYYEKIKKLQSEKLDILGMELMDMKDISELDRYL